MTQLDQLDERRPFHLFVMRHAESRLEYQTTALFGGETLSQDGCAEARSGGCFLASWLQRVQLEGPSDFGRVRVLYGNSGAARETAAFLFKELALAFGGKSGLVQDGPHEKLRILERQMCCVSDVPQGDPLGLFDLSDPAVRHVIVVTDGFTLKGITAAWTHPDLDPRNVSEQTPGGAWTRYLTEDKRQQGGHADHGYVFGPGAPLWNPRATQNQLEQGLAF